MAIYSDLADYAKLCLCHAILRIFYRGFPEALAGSLKRTSENLHGCLRSRPEVKERQARRTRLRRVYLLIRTGYTS
jgi:hypothetical protein